MILIKHVQIYAPEDLGVQDILVDKSLSDDELDQLLDDGMFQTGYGIRLGKILRIAETIDEDALSEVFPELLTIDFRGGAIAPGIIDPHVHVTGGGGEAGFSSRIHELETDTLSTNGVTTVVGVLGTDSRTRSVENLVARIRGLKEEGVSAYCLTGAYELPSVSLTGDVADDVVYIPEVLGVKLAIADHRCSNPTTEELIRLASKVRIASLIGKKPGLIHMHTGKGKNGLKLVVEAIENSDIPAWHFMPTHIRPETPFVKEFLELGGVIDLTSGNTPKTTADYLEYFLTMTAPENITVSSDANGSMPIWNDKNQIVGWKAAELSLYDFFVALVEEKGWSISEALPFITTNTAKRLGLYPQKGCIREGSDADFLIL